MLPDFKINNPPNGGLANIEYLGESSLRESTPIIQSPDFQNHGFRKRCRAVILTSRHIFRMLSSMMRITGLLPFGMNLTPMQIPRNSSISALLNHISAIIRTCSNEKMARIYALRVVALVTDEQTFRNRPKMKRPAYSMRHEHTAGKSKCSISLRTSISFPWPAFIWTPPINLLPKVALVFLSQLRNAFRSRIHICSMGLVRALRGVQLLMRPTILVCSH